MNIHRLISACLALALAVLVFPSVQAADEEPVIKLKVVGEPGNVGKLRGIHYFLWYDAGGWHVRTDSNDKAHTFNGSIRINGGKVTDLGNLDKLEGVGTKKAKAQDFGILSKDKDQITFKFKTIKHQDGFDFQVDSNAKEITFEFLIDGDAATKQVLIGPGNHAAPAAKFTLPAHPE
jgi:hypothetical protein